MSVESSVDLRIVKSSTGEVASPIETIKILVGYGWSLVHKDGWVLYLPIGDDDMFDWKSEKINIESLMKILSVKEDNKELVGVGLIWQDSEIGGEVLFRYEESMLKDNIYESMSFCLSGNRKLLSSNGFEITDVNWYLTKILPAFRDSGFEVEFFSYDEHR